MCRVTMGHLRLTIGYLRVTVGHLRVTTGHLRVTIGFFFYKQTKENTTELHPKVRQTCYLSNIYHYYLFNLTLNHNKSLIYLLFVVVLLKSCSLVEGINSSKTD